MMVIALVVVPAHAPTARLKLGAQLLCYWRTEKPVNNVIAGALPVTPK